MTTKLKEYIENGGSYQEGVSILERLNPLCVELKKLKAYQDKRFAPAAAQELLRKALLDCYQNASFASEFIEALPTPNPQPSTPQDKPLIILKLEEEHRLLRDERRALHFNLEDIPEAHHRATQAQRIRALSQRIDGIFAQLDKWETQNIVPQVATVGDARQGGLEVLELLKKQKYYIERISRLTPLLTDTSIPLSKRERYKAEITLKKAELAVISENLKTLKDH